MFVFIQLWKKILSEQLLDMNIEKIVEFQKEISQFFVGNTKRKNYFLAVCQSFDKM